VRSHPSTAAAAHRWPGVGSVAAFAALSVLAIGLSAAGSAQGQTQAAPAAAAEPRTAVPAAVAEPRQTRPAAAGGPTAAGRPALPLAMPAWVELNSYQREALAPLQPLWNSLPAANKRSWLALTEKLPVMAASDREAAQKRIREWAALSPEQRRMARDNFRLAKSLDRDERLATWESYQQLTPEQRTVLRDNGWTSNTAARHAGAATGLAKEAARPLAARQPGSRTQSGERHVASATRPSAPPAAASAAPASPQQAATPAAPASAAGGAEPAAATESAD